MTENKTTNKPYYKRRSWRLGGSFGSWDVPFCPHCKRQLGLIAAEEQPEICPMCKQKLEWK